MTNKYVGPICKTIDREGNVVNYCEHDVYLQVKEKIHPFFTDSFIDYWKDMVVTYIKSYFVITGKVENPSEPGDILNINLEPESGDGTLVIIKWPLGPKVIELEVWSKWVSQEGTLGRRFARYLIDEGLVDENGIIQEKVDVESEFYNFVFDGLVMQTFENEVISGLSKYGYEVSKTVPQTIDPPAPPDSWVVYFNGGSGDDNTV